MLLLAGVLTGGCRTSSPSRTTPMGASPEGAGGGEAPAPAQRVTPLNELVGRIASVNGPLRFVVIDFPLGRLPQVEQPMAVYRQGQKVAELRVTGPSNGTNIAADIIAGQVASGDEVREN